MLRKKPAKLQKYKADVQKVLSSYGYEDDALDSWFIDSRIKEAMKDNVSAREFAYELITEGY